MTIWEKEIMAEQVSPAKIQQTVKQGFERLKNYRAATAMFVKEYAGHYYRNAQGLTGEEPINLIFNTIRAMVPNLVMKNPVNQIVTPYVAHKEYAELLSMGLNSVERQIKLKQTLRAWIVSALFGWGIMKTGLSVSGQMLQFGDINIDPGQVYAELVNLDNFVLDPMCTDINKATFLGHKTTVPRQMLLDTDVYDHDLVRQLPSATTSKKENSVSSLTQQNAGSREMQSLQDCVRVVELYVPEANALITIPDPYQITFDKYIGITDYYGPKEGPYVFLSFTPPVIGNPLPVAPVSLWYDLHRMANRTFTKIMDQADRQKDIGFYEPALANEAQDIKDASDGDMIASTNPKGVNVVSFGGQNRNNELMLQQLQVWYNYISGNPDQMAGNMTPGTKGSQETATRSQILQGNASISIEDARDILYDQTAEISRRLAWYLHTDPLIDLPLTKRKAGGEEIQLSLTPEQRQGDFLEFTFKIVARSMSRLDPTVRSKRIMEFATNVIPSAATTAQVMLQMGQPFNLQRYLTQMANELGIGEWVGDLFEDPEFQNRLMLMMSMGPQNAGKASPNSPEGVQQNKGFPMKRDVASPEQITNQIAQDTAAEGQAANQGVY